MKTTYRTAIHDAMRDALRDDPRVVLMGEDADTVCVPTAMEREMERCPAL